MALWKAIPGYEGRYEASEAGRVRSIAGGRWGTSPARLLKNSIGSHGYPVVNIRKADEPRPSPQLVHRLVALAFLGECPEGYQVRHRNGNRKIPALYNLSYGTQADNEMDKTRHGTARTSECFLATINRQKAGAIRALISLGYAPIRLATAFGVTRQTICDISKGRSWKGIVPLPADVALRILSKQEEVT